MPFSSKKAVCWPSSATLFRLPGSIHFLELSPVGAIHFAMLGILPFSAHSTTIESARYIQIDPRKANWYRLLADSFAAELQRHDVARVGFPDDYSYSTPAIYDPDFPTVVTLPQP